MAWQALIRTAAQQIVPELINVAVRQAREFKVGKTDNLADRVAALEDFQKQQNQVIQQLVTQNEKLVSAMQRVAGRLVLLTWLSAGLGVIVVVLVGLLLARG